jgi:tetratricopeptide (TPR) repeat protein
MFTAPIDLPEPFAGALMRGEPATVCDAPAETPEAVYARGLARIAVGREVDARADLLAAAESLGDGCRVELAYLDLRSHGAVEAAAVAASEIAKRTPQDTRLAARAWHVAGQALGKLRCQEAAATALLRAADIYRALMDRAGLAQVHDTLGMLEAARGRFDHAMNFYALSLVDKTLHGDRQGMAITLGNLGRIHLRAARYREAAYCFERDLELATAMGDVRGQARMHNDLGRAYLDMGALSRAESELQACLELAERHAYRDVQFFVHKDLALLRLAQWLAENPRMRSRRLAEADRELQISEELLPPGAEPYIGLLLLAAHGELEAARGDPQAADTLTEAAAGFAREDLPDLEIAVQLALARVLNSAGRGRAAERALRRGLSLSRQDGFARYRDLINQEMTRLVIMEPLEEEQGREVVQDLAVQPSGYLFRERLGEGAFGEVWRAYDPERFGDVAYKRLKLDQIYDVGRRQRVMATGRVELDSASRIRHPGVVRVLAIGTEPSGAAYVVQEFVPGCSLRSQMPDNAAADVGRVVACLEKIAHALAALHEAGVVHRDLKPENVLLREGGSPVLVDFGLAFLPDEPRKDAQRNLIVGTLAYMPPEQAAGDEVDHRADLYALGVIAYEWLAGDRPVHFPDAYTVPERLAHLSRGKYELHSLAAYRPKLPPPLVDLVMKLLERKPRNRPKTAAAVAQELARIAAALPRRLAALADDAASTIARQATDGTGLNARERTADGS